MKLLEVEGGGHVLQCPIAGDATEGGLRLNGIVPIVAHPSML